MTRRSTTKGYDLTHHATHPDDTHSQCGMHAVEVQLFAAAAERAGVRQLTVPVPPAASLAELRNRLVQVCPKLKALVANSRWAVDCEFVELDFVINGDTAIAMIPPVSGG